MKKFQFRTKLGEEIFRNKYANGPNDTWPHLAERVVDDVCGTRNGTTTRLMSKDDCDQLAQYIADMKFLPGGRYLYYAGRPAHFWNNCFCLAAEEDTREEWGALAQRATLALMSGGGIGVDYSVLRHAGSRLSRTGGISSGPIPMMKIINEIGRNVMQGGSRRSAVWAGLNWQHKDIDDFLCAKDWSEDVVWLKAKNFDFPAPLDMTNISVLWDTEFIENHRNLVDHQYVLPEVWEKSVLQMCRTGEPGHCYNFYEHEKETLRNACTEFISDKDSDCCNLGSINLANIATIDEFHDVVCLASKFLVCGTMRAELPYEKVRHVREEYRKIGLGLMGLHEWLLARGYGYEVTDELRLWLEVYHNMSERAAKEHANRFFLSTPARFRAIAPTGTLGLLAGTSQGIEPIYSVAYKRRYLEGTTWRYQYVIDPTAERVIQAYGIDPHTIQTALSLAREPEQRIKFQADIQDYVDMGISSTINLPTWGTEFNNEDTATKLSQLLAKYCPRLRGITAYPDGARGGQPITEVEYEYAKKQRGVIFAENEDSCKSGVCGL